MTSATAPSLLRRPSVPATRRTFLPRVLERRALLTATLGLAFLATPSAAQQSSLTFSFASSSPTHAIWAGVSAGPGGAFVVQPVGSYGGTFTTGVPWANPGLYAFPGWRGSHRGNSWRRAGGLGISCWDAWRDPWFAYWPYCEPTALYAWGGGWHRRWASRPMIGFAWAPYTYWGPASSWTFALHFGSVWDWGWRSSRSWSHWTVNAPWTSVYVTSPILWAVREPPARVVRAGPSHAVGSGGWVTAPTTGYKEDATAAARAATARTGSTAPSTRTATPSRTVAETPAAAVRSTSPSPTSERPPLGTPIRLGRLGDTDSTRGTAAVPQSQRGARESNATDPTPSVARSAPSRARTQAQPQTRSTPPGSVPSTRSAPPSSARVAPAPSTTRTGTRAPVRSTAPAAARSAPAARAAPTASPRSAPAPAARSAPAPAARSAPAAGRAAPTPSARSAPAAGRAPSASPSPRARAVPATRTPGG